jgi:DNA-binding transcriptional ArsR family regulator
MTAYDNLAVRFKALAHPVRLQILDMLRSGEACVCHMETALNKRQAYISQQLMVLRDMTAVLLDTILGPVEEERRTRLEGCPCPHCVVEVETIF